MAFTETITEKGKEDPSHKNAQDDLRGSVTALLAFRRLCLFCGCPGFAFSLVVILNPRRLCAGGEESSVLFRAFSVIVTGLAVNPWRFCERGEESSAIVILNPRRPCVGGEESLRWPGIHPMRMLMASAIKEEGW